MNADLPGPFADVKGIIFQSGVFVPFIQIVQQNVLQPGTQLPIAEQSQQPFTSVVIGQEVEVGVVAAQNKC